MATTRSPSAPGEPPNRLKGRTRWAVRECAPMLYHLARARGVDPSQVSRELSGERRSALAETEQILRAYARGRKTDPSPLLLRFHQAVQEELQAVRIACAWREYDRLCEEETRSKGRCDLSQLKARSHRSSESLDEVEENLSRHGARVIQLLAWIPVVRKNL